MTDDPWAAFPVASSGSASADPWAAFPKAPVEKPSVVEDMAKSAGANYLRGVAGIPGAAADIGSLAQKGVSWVQSKAQGRPLPEIEAENRANAVISPERLAKWGSEGWIHSLEQAREGLTGEDSKLYTAQTTPGKYVGAAASLAPTAAFGAGGVARKAAQIIAPSVTGETAGQIADRIAPSFSTAARVVGTMAGGGATALAQAPRGAKALVGEGLHGFTQEELAAADALIQNGSQQGVHLTRGEALNQVTNGRAARLSQLERVAANSEGGQPLRDIYAARPRQIQAAGQGAIESVAPDPYPADVAAIRGQEAAQGAVAATPEGQNLAQNLALNAPRTTAEDAGQVIQPALRETYDRREGMRAALADRDYAAARNTSSDVPVGERMVDVTRTVHDPVTVSDLPEISASPSGAPAAGGAAAVPLSRYIAQNGGLSMEGGEAAAAGFDKINIPFAGRLAHEKGRPIDGYWREKLIEDGYLPPDSDGGMSRDIRGELYKALHDERAGKPTFSVYDADRVGARSDAGVAAENARGLDSIKSDIIRQHVAAGVKPSELHPELVDRAAAAIHNGHETDPLTAYERAATQSVQATSERLVPREVTESIPDVVYGQVNANPVVAHIDTALETAKGAPRTALKQARTALHKTNGDLDSTVAGLDASRKAISDLIDKAKRSGANQSAREMEGTLAELDRALQQVPEYAKAKQGFEAASVPLAPFAENRAPGQIVARDQYERDFAMPAEKAPAAVLDGGPSAVRDFLSVAPRDARMALENHLATRLVDAATDARGNLSADKLTKALRDSEDVIRQMPNVQDRIAQIVSARRGMAPVENGPLGKVAAADPGAPGATSKMGGALVGVGEGDRYHPVVQQAVRRMVKQDPRAAETLARDYIGQEFQNATKGLRPGSDQYGGAGFRAALDPILPNLRAVVTQLPQGQQRWAGFQRFLDVAEATGWKPVKGSDTAFNIDIQKQLQGAGSIAGATAETVAGMAAGGAVGGAAGAAGAGTIALKHALQERYVRYVRGGNVAEIADLLTNRASAPLLSQLARTPANSERARALALRLTYMGEASANQPAPQGR